MAFPQVHATTFSDETVDTTTHDVDLTGVASGDRLILSAFNDNDGTAVVLSGMPAGWTQIFSDQSTAGGGIFVEVWEKLDASGAESSFTYTTSISQKSNNRVFLVSGSHTSEAADVSASVSAAGANPDPGSVTAGWGSDDNLFVTGYGSTNKREKATAFPTNYNDNQHTVDSTSNDNTFTNYGLATRELASASNDPGTFTKANTGRAISFTMVVRPKVGTALGVGRVDETDTAQTIAAALSGQFPSSPSGLTALVPTPSQVDLAWTGVVDPEGRAVGYDVERQKLTGPGGSPVGNPEILADNWNDTSFSDVEAIKETTYEYRVRGVIIIRPFVRQAEEVDFARSLGGSLSVEVSLASESDVGLPLTFVLSGGGGGGGFGVDSPGAPISIPAFAVTATTSTLASLINSNSGGTDFALAAGTYNGAYPNKAGNGYYGLADHTAVVFNGNATYPNFNTGTPSDGGTTEMMSGENNNTWANMTIQRYRGIIGKAGSSAIDHRGTSGWKFRNVLFQHMEKVGLTVGGSNGEARFCTSRYNGAFGWSGGGTDNHFWNCEAYSIADNTMLAQGLTPRFSGSDVGISKHAQSTRVQHHSGWYHDIDHGSPKGLWWDINNRGMLMEDCVIENILNKGLHFELSHDGIIRRNIFRNCGRGPSQSAYGRATLLANVSGVTIIEDNEVYGAVTGTKSQAGIFLQTNDRDHGPEGGPGGPASIPQNWSAQCGSIIRNNFVEGDFETAHIGVRCVYTKDGCNFFTTPSSITVANNTEVGSPVKFYRNGSVTASQWATAGYS